MITEPLKHRERHAHDHPGNRRLPLTHDHPRIDATTSVTDRHGHSKIVMGWAGTAGRVAAV